MYKFTTADGVTRVRGRFENVDEGDAYMVEMWNATVKPSDKIWHLGDVTMGRTAWERDRITKLMKGLNGHKRLVLGNHDHFGPRDYAEMGFEKVCGVHNLEKLLLSHVPLHPSSVAGWCIANVHGHIHQQDSPPGPYVNVCVEKTDYMPIALEDVVKLAKKAREEGER
ncbi:MAG TPA: hypothetical protein VD994_02410 [Prosthecobacter sp.]|nr:hypothetical protein [Prosthecobacter sp.]